MLLNIRRKFKRLILSCIPSNAVYIVYLILSRYKTILYYILRLFPIKENKLFICNFRGKGYGDSAKYIVEELVKKSSNFEFVWAVDNVKDSNFPAYVRLVKYGSIRAIYEEVTSRVWIDNCRKFFFVRKRKKQFYIQTWHGCISLKRIERDAEANLSTIYLASAKHDSNMVDAMLSNSRFCTDMYKEAFWYGGAIWEVGLPRNDILLNGVPNKHKLYSHFNINAQVMIVLYAPTFRANHTLDFYDLDFRRVINTLNGKYSKKIVILVRLHPNIAYNSTFIEYDDSIINASKYSDIQELLSISDILITDYSSTMFEFMIMKKPVFLYARDIERYSKERNFYFAFNDLPFSLSSDNKDLISNIQNFDCDNYYQIIDEFMENLGLNESGEASAYCSEKIEEICSEFNTPRRAPS